MSVSAPHAHAYAAYLNGAEWGRRRKRALAEAGHKCARCGNEDMLEVHHLTYERLGNERSEDLRVLCNPCHSDEHGRPARGQPVVNRKELIKRERERLAVEWQQERVLLASVTASAREAIDRLADVSLAGEGMYEEELDQDLKTAQAALARVAHRLLGSA